MKFIHIGCWNYKDFSESSVSKSLNNFVNNNFQENDFIVIAGDNYYPNIEKYDNTKIKWINVENFIEGLNSMPENPKKYLLFGDNDINDKTILDEDSKNNLKEMFKDYKGYDSFNNIIEDFNKMKTCRLVDIELLYTKTKGKNYKIYDDVMSIKCNKTLIIMIDTSIYDKEINYESVQCYKRILEKDYYKKLTLEELINEQNKKIEKIINENINDCNNIIIIGHHPICGMKTIKAENINNNECYYNEKLVDLFRCVSKCIKDNKVTTKIIYLCSHIHLYQRSEINIDDIIIEQYICGCGGAILDNLTTDMVNKKDANYEIIIRHEDIYIKIKELVNQTYGYLSITIPENDNNLEIEFIKAKEINKQDENEINEKTKKNYEKKYMKYKSKYLNKKLN